MKLWTLTLTETRRVECPASTAATNRLQEMSPLLKVNFALEETIKSRKGSRGIAVLFL